MMRRRAAEALPRGSEASWLVLIGFHYQLCIKPVMLESKFRELGFVDAVPKNEPQGLKPASLAASNGAAEAAPFYNLFMKPAHFYEPVHSHLKPGLSQPIYKNSSRHVK
jgi:hypothetical protein